MSPSRARAVHTLGAAVTIATLVLQTVLVVSGAASVAVTCLGVTVLSVALALGLSALDRRMPSAPVREAAPGPSGVAPTAQ